MEPLGGAVYRTRRYYIILPRSCYTSRVEIPDRLAERVRSFFLAFVPMKVWRLYSTLSIIIRRLERDRPFVNPVDSFSIQQVIASITSPQVIILFILYFMGGTNLFGLALFLPSIVNQLGYSANHSQLLSVGPFAAGFVGELSPGLISNRHHFI